MESNNHSAEKPKRRDPARGIGAGIAIGMGAGVALGLALGNIALGIAIGVAIGVAIGAALNSDAAIEGDEASFGKRGFLVLMLLTGLFAFALLAFVFLSYS